MTTRRQCRASVIWSGLLRASVGTRTPAKIDEDYQKISGGDMKKILSTITLAAAILAGLGTSHASASSQPPLNLCLFWSFNYCTATTSSTNTTQDMEYHTNGLVEVWMVSKTAHGWQIQDQANGLCLGAWKYNQHPYLASCKSAHGVYWNFINPVGAQEYIQNTYVKAYLTTTGPHAGAPVWVHAKGKDWQDWVFNATA